MQRGMNSGGLMKERRGEMKRLIATGNTADVFEYEEGKVCKLFREDYSQPAIEREYHNAKQMKQLGIAVPACYGIITSHKRSGIIYERIEGKSLLEHCTETQDTTFLEETLVTLHTSILQNHTREVMSYKDFLIQLIPKDTSEGSVLVERINNLPEGDALCHGDFHPMNIMVTGHKEVFLIDFMNVCHGPWQYDVARTYFLISYDDIPNEAPHKQVFLQMKRQLADTYLEKMNVVYKEIEGLLAIIHACRQYE